MRAASALGRALATRELTLVYGGANVGLMGAVADAALASGGRVIGVIPDFLVEKEVAHASLTQIHVVRSMHERKAMMAERADAFVSLPGGYGTLDETFEMLTWSQLSLHAKPSALLSVDGYYDKLALFLDHAADEGLLRREHRDMLLVDDDAVRLVKRLVESA
jgi:uncharacterized protein (TIGR00730 family)